MRLSFDGAVLSGVMHQARWMARSSFCSSRITPTGLIPVAVVCEHGELDLHL
jgi:hypothetical protein